MKVLSALIVLTIATPIGCSHVGVIFEVSSQSHDETHHSVEVMSVNAIELSDANSEKAMETFMGRARFLCAPREVKVEMDSLLEASIFVASSDGAVGQLGLSGDIECR